MLYAVAKQREDRNSSGQLWDLTMLAEWYYASIISVNTFLAVAISLLSEMSIERTSWVLSHDNIAYFWTSWNYWQVDQILISDSFSMKFNFIEVKQLVESWSYVLIFVSFMEMYPKNSKSSRRETEGLKRKGRPFN